MFEAFELSTLDWVLLFVCGTIVGMAKTGVAGVFYIVLPILASIFGGRNSTGILLPILIMADVFGVAYYNRSADWKIVLKLLPVTIIGIGIGTYVGSNISDEMFKKVMGGILLLGLVIMIWMEFRKEKSIPKHWSISTATGLASGFSTMVGNAAGSTLSVYLLSQRLPKNSFIGTTAWFFMIVNLTKVPFHLFIWKTLSWPSLALDLMLLPAIALGAWMGVRIVKMVPEKFYRWFIIVVTGLSALAMII